MREDLVQGQVLCNLANTAATGASVRKIGEAPLQHCGYPGYPVEQLASYGSHGKFLSIWNAHSAQMFTVLKARELSCLLANTRRQACFKSCLAKDLKRKSKKCAARVHCFIYLGYMRCLEQMKQELIKILMQNNVEQFHLCQDQILLRVGRIENQKKCKRSEMTNLQINSSRGRLSQSIQSSHSHHNCQYCHCECSD